jgi:hypothetical protein
MGGDPARLHRHKVPQVRTRVPVADGALFLEPRDEDAELLERWLPRPHPDPDEPRAGVTLRVIGDSERQWIAGQLEGPPTLSLGTVRASVEATTRRVALAGRIGVGVLDLARGMGAIDSGGALEDGYTMLTLAAGLLLAAQGRVLAHAAAVRRPDGGVLLLAGDSRAGKSTTTLTLARAPGWAWLSDDQVVLAPRQDESVEVLGWARQAHLDEGYDRGESTGQRRDADPALIARLPWVARGILAGAVLPVVRPDYPSARRPATATAALEALIRQGAWILAEGVAARMALGVLRTAAGKEAWHLDLGRDTYAEPDRLAAMVLGTP